MSFIGVAAAAIAQLIPEWAGIALAALPWVTAQAELRYRTGSIPVADGAAASSRLRR